jgi:hypothetical protein
MRSIFRLPCSMLAFVRSLFFKPWSTSSKETLPDEPKPKIIILPKGRHVLTPNQLITLACQDHKTHCPNVSGVPKPEPNHEQ